jgi:hypothetical protein
MEFEDFLEPEIAITATVAAALFSPRGRNWLRRGIVYGTAGVLMAGDAVTSFVRSVGQGAQKAGATMTEGMAQATGSSQTAQENPPSGGQNA